MQYKKKCPVCRTSVYFDDKSVVKPEVKIIDCDCDIFEVTEEEMFDDVKKAVMGKCIKCGHKFSLPYAIIKVLSGKVLVRTRKKRTKKSKK